MSTYLWTAFIIGRYVAPLFLVALLLDEAYKIRAARRVGRES